MPAPLNFSLFEIFLTIENCLCFWKTFRVIMSCYISPLSLSKQ